MRQPLLLCLLAAAGFAPSAGAVDQPVIDHLFQEALVRGHAYEQLRVLVDQCPARLSGTASLSRAFDWAERELAPLHLDRVYRQEVRVPHWERGEPESVVLIPSRGPTSPLAATALGFSAATSTDGLIAPVVAVHSLDELAALGRERVAGRIVFFNRPMDASLYYPDKAYGAAADQRMKGPAAAAQLGAIGALTRSLTFTHDDVPHTGTTRFPSGVTPIPAAALSSVAADRLSSALASDPALRVRLQVHARLLPDAPSCNLVGEIRGSEHPDEVIVLGGHMDSWDNTPGAHDDGAGIVQSLEVMRIFRALGLKPRHTIRCVLFTSEENSLNGGNAYAAAARAAGQRHLFAVESDAGGFAPAGFRIHSAAGDGPERLARWRPLLERWGVRDFRAGLGGSDVEPLFGTDTATADLMPDSQRYFDYHHAATDTFAAVNERELHLGAGALAALVWLVDQEGL